MMVGFPASGKSTYANDLVAMADNPDVFVIISRDILGGKTSHLISKVSENIKNGKTVILDNTNMTKQIRAEFIDIAKSLKCPIEAIYISTTIEECQIRALKRMYAKYGDMYMTGKTNLHNDPGIFPPATLFSARKKFEEPTLDEGFITIRKICPFLIEWPYKNRAIFFDIDGTLRKTDHLPNKYPTKIEEVILACDPKIIQKYKDEGYLIIGISNQSGIAKGTVTEKEVIACMEETKRQIGIDFPISFCPHRAAPISCYCRKPQMGQVLKYIETYKLDPTACLFVGDMKTDETLANRLRMPFRYAKDIF
jgi:HAD superfamily hydrolase (TIGR01662 family)